MTDETKVTREKRADSMGAIIDMAADLVSEVYNDPKMTPAEKIKSFSQGQRVIISTRAEMRKTASDLARMGFKANGEVDRLAYNPITDD